MRSDWFSIAIQIQVGERKTEGDDRGQMLLSASKSHRANHLASQTTTKRTDSGVECVCVCIKCVPRQAFV